MSQISFNVEEDRHADGYHPMWFGTFYKGYYVQRRPLGWSFQGKDRVWHVITDRNLPLTEAKRLMAVQLERKHT